MVDIKHIQTEVDASFLYGVLAKNEEDTNVAEVFKQMSEIELSHAVAFLKKKQIGRISVAVTICKGQNIK